MKDEISKLTALVEQDGTYESKLSREVAANCVRAQYETAFDYGIYHDTLVWESDIIREHILERAISLLKERGFAKVHDSGKYAGCLAVNFSDIRDLPPELAGMKENVKVLLRSDGSPTYVAKDIAFHMWKFGLLENTFKFDTFIEKQPNGKPLLTTSPEGKSTEFKSADRAINVIANEQSFPQLLVKLAFKGIGRDEIFDRLYHLSYGRVSLEEGKLSGRKGGAKEYSAKRLLEMAEEKAYTLISDRFELSEKEKKGIAHDVALAAIKFEFLRISPEKEIIFSWSRAMNFEGGSGPYSQYMHARASKILASAGDASGDAPDYASISDGQGFALVMALAQARSIVSKACIENRPNAICDYLNDLSAGFSSFYESYPVLKAEGSVRAARLLLVKAFAKIQKEMLTLLGIPTPERM
ncbi:MAG: DALR anticodon-binding domain-containing protein, partial [Candidatus Micrarchaeaceae archaeon]